MTPIQVFALRLKPGEDLKNALQQFVHDNNIEAGWITACAGSLDAYNIRFANRNEGMNGNGHFEIVSLSGTVSVNGSHIHISIADEGGIVTGGHLLEGCKIYTTAEIILNATEDLVFSRENDGTTPWKELQILKLNR